MKEEIEQLIQWLQQHLKQNGLKGVLVGVSGGLDSAVVAALIKRAFPDHSLGVLLPCKNNEWDLDDARKVVDAVDIDQVTVDLSSAHDAMFTRIQGALYEKGTWNEQTSRLDDGNLRARLRMGALYTIAAQYGYMVAGTDNAAEWYTGYFTKFGDGGVDMIPLIHYTKNQVFEFARYLDVPDDIIRKKPSAELWEGQTDESEMGTTYAKIDAYLRGEEVPEEDRRVIERLHEKSAHKRALPVTPPQF